MIGEFIKLTRFEHAVMLALAVLITETIVLGALPPLEFAIAMSLLVPVFSEMGSFALNDYFDVETDRLNKKKDRPLVKGTITPRCALYVAFASLIFSTVFAFGINLMAFTIAGLFNITAILYNWRLKDLPLVGNFYIALTMAIPFIFGNYVVSQELSPVALVLAVLGFVAGLAREIIKSVQDMEGDMKARGSRTLPVIIGKKPSMVVAVSLYLFFIPLTAVPFMLGLAASALPLALIAAADIMIAVICYRIMAEHAFGFARNASLIAFSLGMIGILIASL